MAAEMGVLQHLPFLNVLCSSDESQCGHEQNLPSSVEALTRCSQESYLPDLLADLERPLCQNWIPIHFLKVSLALTHYIFVDE